MRYCLSIVLLVLLSACGAGGPASKTFWKKDSATYEDAVTDEAHCRTKGMELVLGTPKEVSPAEVDKYVSNCMKSMGFRWGQYSQ